MNSINNSKCRINIKIDFSVFPDGYLLNYLPRLMLMGAHENYTIFLKVSNQAVIFIF